MSNNNKNPFYFGAEKREIFGWFHPGKSEQQRPIGIVLCNPIGDDYIRAHRTLRHIADDLSAAGFPVLRFDFHGTGDSTGTEEDAERVNCWLNDIDLAIEKLRNLSGVKKFALVGLKLGATLAAVAAEKRTDVESLILWSPYLSGKEYVSDSTRIHKIQKILEPSAYQMDFPPRHIEGEECLGFVLSDSTIADLNKIDLMQIQNLSAKKVLILGTGGSGAWQEKLAAHLIKMGSKVEIQKSNGSDKFLISINHQASVPKTVVSLITDWLKNQDVENTTHDFKKVPERLTFHEEPIFFGENQSLFGILHSHTTPQPQRPMVVMLNSGTVHRIGPHRLYVKMSRHWAELGFSVFRIDLSGIGDSPAEAAEENLCYPPNALKNIQAAFTELENRFGVKRFVLVGLCSGADITFKMGLKDPRVIGTVMMNPLTFCVQDPFTVEDWNRAAIMKDSIASKKKWIRLLKGDINILRAAVSSASLMRLFLNPILKKDRKACPEFTNDGESSLIQATETVPDRLRRMANNGVDILLVAVENDPGVHYVDAHFGNAMTALKNVKGYRREDFRGMDHTFTSVSAQEVVIKTITDHLSRKYL